jgi:hypothetical protein
VPAAQFSHGAALARARPSCCQMLRWPERFFILTNRNI